VTFLIDSLLLGGSYDTMPNKLSRKTRTFLMCDVRKSEELTLFLQVSASVQPHKTVLLCEDIGYF